MPHLIIRIQIQIPTIFIHQKFIQNHFYTGFIDIQTTLYPDTWRTIGEHNVGRAPLMSYLINGMEWKRRACTAIMDKKNKFYVYWIMHIAPKNLAAFYHIYITYTCSFIGPIVLLYLIWETQTNFYYIYITYIMFKLTLNGEKYVSYIHDKYQRRW